MAKQGYIAIAMRKVYQNAQAHCDYQPRPDFHQLVEEVLELSQALRANHEHPIEFELIQIGGIVLNWLADIEEAESGRVAHAPLEVKSFERGTPLGEEVAVKKAKDYAKELRINPTEKTLVRIAQQFLNEVSDLIHSRGVSTPGGHISILDEQDRKWKAFARHFEGIVRPDGFEELIKAHFPAVHAVWRGPLCYKNRRK